MLYYIAAVFDVCLCVAGSAGSVERVVCPGRSVHTHPNRHPRPPVQPCVSAAVLAASWPRLTFLSNDYSNPVSCTICT